MAAEPFASPARLASHPSDFEQISVHQHRFPVAAMLPMLSPETVGLAPRPRARQNLRHNSRKIDSAHRLTNHNSDRFSRVPPILGTSVVTMPLHSPESHHNEASLSQNLPLHARIERISKTIAYQVDGKRCQKDRKPRKEYICPVGTVERLCFRKHISP